MISDMETVPVKRVYPDHLKKYAESYTAMDHDGLWSEWDRLMGWSVEIIERQAVILSELVRLNDDRIAEIKARWPERFSRLLLVAEGQLVPSVLYRFNARPALLRRIAALPASRQHELAASDRVEVMVRGEDGKPTTRMMELSSLSDTLVNQVFSADGERTFTQQIAYVEGRPSAVARPAKRKDVLVDHRAGGIRVRNECFLSVSELEQYLAQLRRGR